MDKICVTLCLEKGINTESSLYRIRQGWYLRFTIGQSLIGHDVNFFSNYPTNPNDCFIRSKYTSVPLINPTNNNNDIYDNYFEISASNHSGAYQFYITLDGDDKKMGEGYFIVDPRFGQGNNSWELDGVVLQTYLSKNLGKFKSWLPKLEVSKQAGYNMIHFTPLQELGYSRSAYSLADHLAINSEFETTWDEVEKLVKLLESEWNMFAMTDLVYNHAASNSVWIHEHPYCAYNIDNSPHLRPAYLVDRIIWNITLAAMDGELKNRGVGDTFTEDYQLGVISAVFWEKIEEIRLYEYFLADVDFVVKSFRNFIEKNEKEIMTANPDDNYQLALNHKNYLRKQSTIDYLQAAIKLYRPSRNIDQACNELTNHLHQLNSQSKQTFYGHMDAAVNNFLANAKYRFLDPHGLKLGKITRDSPLMWNYFYHPFEELNLHSIEKLIIDSKAARGVMAYNGWVIGDDPMRNFAESHSNVYLRRELIVWGDSVKLRYGQTEADCPYLWQKMKEYTQLAAKIFHAVRLDNCHSTPIHVAQWMLDQARAIRKDIYIVAELFTGHESIDNAFINKLGINSLIREAQGAKDSHDLGRMIHRYGGLPVGSFVQKKERPLLPSMAHALLYDATHDNEAAILRHSAIDILPTGALVCMAQCAIGSNRGYDELVPHYIDVVKEERKYRSWSNDEKADNFIHLSTGVIAAKAFLNRLHQKLIKESYCELFVDQVDSDIVAVTRHSSANRSSYILIAHTAFSPPSTIKHRPIKSMQLPGKVTRVEMECTTNLTLDQYHQLFNQFTQHKDVINGFSHFHITTNIRAEPFSVKESKLVKVDDILSSSTQQLHFVNFPPGSVILLKIEMVGEANSSLNILHQLIASEFQAQVRSRSCGPILSVEGIDNVKATTNLPKMKHLREIACELSFSDLNYILYRCEAEDRTDNPEAGAYEVMGFSRFNYCGLQTIVNLLDDIRPKNDLGHPLCGNLRDGNWLMNFITQRLIKYKQKSVQDVGIFLQLFFVHIGRLPNYLRPCYFDCIISHVYDTLIKEVYCQFGDEIQTSSSFRKELCRNSLIFLGSVSNCGLPSLHPSVIDNLSGKIKNQLLSKQGFPTIAAGLPHFASGLFRSWGRDTFIAFRGLLLLTKRFEEAKVLLLSYGALLRHGLMPNLLGNWNSQDKSIHSRYNCRDAIWWWLYSIQQYSILSNDNGQILQSKVFRLFPPSKEQEMFENHKNDPAWLRCPKRIEPQACKLHDLIYEALQRHASGIDFVEWGAGWQLDECMSQEGFHVTAKLFIDKNNFIGFPCGGNSYNCGTWMDKMGSSEKAGNRSKPATSRNGVAVELVGLCYVVVKWIASLHSQGNFPQSNVTVASESITWEQWSLAIEKNFDSYFWIDVNDKNPESSYNAGGYKDLVGSIEHFSDFQFRPNFLVTMAIAPELFPPDHAWIALEKARKELLGPLGMRTLSKNDLQYRGSYDNGADTHDFHTAKGFNYHQGPEWVWPVGFYLQAYLQFAAKQKSDRILKDAKHHVQQVLARLREHMKHSQWNSLPELTNEEGSFCRDSCPAQAWSAACVHEALVALIASSKAMR